MRRRTFLAGSAAWLAAAAVDRLPAAPPNPLAAFFVVGDTHFLADGSTPGQLEPTSQEYTAGLLKVLARLPGTALPEAIGGGTVVDPQGLLHVGDIIDSGDKSSPKHLAMQQAEWAAYAKAFTPTRGGAGALPFPTYEIVGNHDAPHGQGYVIEQLARRQRARRDLRGVSANGLHYSWDWGGAHFVALGLIVGENHEVVRPRRYAALESLAFLKEDLAAHSDIDQPLVLLHHVDVARYSDEKAGVDYSRREWDPADVQAFHGLLQGRRTAIFHGHTHFRDVFRWNAQRGRGGAGAAVYNVSQASHYGSQRHAFFYVELFADRLRVREYVTKDGWASAEWTPEVWESMW